MNTSNIHHHHYINDILINTDLEEHSLFHHFHLKKTFTQKAYQKFSSPPPTLEEKSDPSFTKVMVALQSHETIETGSPILDQLPNELKDRIFRYLKAEDLRSCLCVNRQFYASAASLYTKEALSTLSADFKRLEKHIDEQEFLMLKQLKHLKQLSSFKAHCLLIQLYQGDRENNKMEDILGAIVCLQKLCQEKLMKWEQLIPPIKLSPIKIDNNFIEDLIQSSPNLNDKPSHHRLPQKYNPSCCTLC